MMKAMVLALGLAAILATVVGLTLAPSPSGAPAQAQGQASPAAPANVRAVNGVEPGQAVVRWDAVADAAYYRIGWVNMETFRAVQAEGGREWLDVFAFHDVVNRGQTSQTLSDLAGRGVRFYCGQRGASLWQRRELVGLDLSDHDGCGGGVLPDEYGDGAGGARKQWRYSDANPGAGGYRYADAYRRAGTGNVLDPTPTARPAAAADSGAGGGARGAYADTYRRAGRERV